MNDSKDFNKLIDSLGNEPTDRDNTPDFIEWMENNNPLSDLNTQNKTKSKCKSGKCGNNTKTFIMIGVLVFLTMWAGYGLFSFIANLFQ